MYKLQIKGYSNYSFTADDTNDPEFLQVENPAIAETMDNHSLEVNVDVHLSGEAV